MSATSPHGDLYFYLLDGERRRPDPVSRHQPEGPHGPSAIVDPSIFAWTDSGWRGVRREGQVLYELHVGTFTPEGTWASAMARLPHLVDVGITVIQMMPVADFPGRWGWGYDGVNLYAPTRLYGTPDDLRRFVDNAHALGIGVILDVVYNHLGPDGNYLGDFSRGLLHGPLHERLGKRSELRRALAGARFLSREPRVLGRGVSLRRVSSRCHARGARRVVGTRAGGAGAPGTRGCWRATNLCRCRERAAASGDRP